MRAHALAAGNDHIGVSKPHGHRGRAFAYDVYTNQ
jgi:hypothetical protein